MVGRMTFLEAVALIKAHHAGPNAIAVVRPDKFSFLFAAAPLPDGRQFLMGGYVARGRKSDTHSAVLTAQDIEATDWEIIEL